MVLGIGGNLIYTVKPRYKQPIPQALQIAYIGGLHIVKFLYRLVETRVISSIYNLCCIWIDLFM